MPCGSSASSAGSLLIFGGAARVPQWASARRPRYGAPGSGNSGGGRPLTEALDCMRTDVPVLNVEVKMRRNLFEGYRPHFRVGDGEHLGISFEKVEPSSQLDTYRAAVALVYPGVDYRALVEGVEFEILEGMRVVGTGRVLSK